MHDLESSPSAVASTSSGSTSLPSTEYPDHVVVLYASETGSAQDIAERTAREFRRLGRRCVVQSMDMFDVFDLPHTPLLILITSTHGRGDPPPAMLPLWTALLRTSLPEDILEDVNYAIYGLGDSSYERFCFAGKMLARRLDGLGANKLSEPAWGDERAPDGYEETFIPWLQQTVELMTPHLPADPAFSPLPPTALPPPIFELDYAPSVSTLSLHDQANGHSAQPAPPRTVDAANGLGQEDTKPDDWHWAKLTRNRRVTAEDWWQDVREIELELEDTESFAGYAPGSICNLQPRSDPAEVQEFLEAMQLSSRADEEFTIISSIPNQPLPPHLPPGRTSLRKLLTNHLDIRCSPRKSFFEWLRRLSTDEREQERLDEFLADPDEIFTYATRPSRTIVETLADFREVRLPLSHLLEILPPLRRRQFSIASSWESHVGKVQLLVALVEYKTNLKIPRRGLCSSWLNTLAEGTRLPVKINPPTLFTPAPDVPVILVGPGTGVAPMRAFVEERVRQGAAKNTILYFGCRSASSDLYYQPEWEEYRTKGVRIEVAASRDQDEKVYVQHLIKRDAQMIRDWVFEQNGHVYISGSSNAMPREVREAIAWCIQQGGEYDEESAKAYVDEMFDSGRGGEESW